MKKLFVIVCALIVAAACAAPPTNRESATTANTNSAEKSGAPLSEADAIAKEKAAWAALEKKDLAAFGDMLASDYVEVGDERVDNKASVLDYLKDLEISNPTFSDWKVMPIDKDAVLLTYNVTLKGTYKGKAFPPGPYRASAAWVNRDGKWQGIYYQETLAATAPPTPPPASTPAKSSASPAAKPADTAIPTDPVAREKMVWDTLKRKDYDTFASFLDAAQIEVEADGVSDKAGTLKGVRMFDASKYEQSDFKTVNFDTDATLVTYVVKSANPKDPIERHTTIWVMRDGKWRALFHQGTPAMKPGTPAMSASPTVSPKASTSPKASPAAKAPAKTP